MHELDAMADPFNEFNIICLEIVKVLNPDWTFPTDYSPYYSKDKIIQLSPIEEDCFFSEKHAVAVKYFNYMLEQGETSVSTYNTVA